MYKEAPVLSALLKVCTVPCHDRGHIIVIVVLQSCTDPLYILEGSSSETYATSCNISNVKVEEDVGVKEMVFIALNGEVDVGIKQEEVSEDITSPDIKAEPDEVRYVFICLLLDTFYLCPETLFFVMSVLLSNWNSSNFGKVGFSLLDGLFSNNCREDEILLYIHVGKNPYPQDVSIRLHHFQVLVQYNLSNLPPTGVERCWINKSSIYQRVPVLT
jgi:hypothetical protein